MSWITHNITQYEKLQTTKKAQKAGIIFSHIIADFNTKKETETKIIKDFLKKYPQL